MDKIKLHPKDYIIFAGGLMVKNVSDNNVIEFEANRQYSIWKLKSEKELQDEKMLKKLNIDN